MFSQLRLFYLLSIGFFVFTLTVILDAFDLDFFSFVSFLL
uniref:Uncharacterized protein n=1 Tax=Rhizophora mucronata TaxID=61149 RepID=A0A2P2MIQ4_RHIMU